MLPRNKGVRFECSATLLCNKSICFVYLVAVQWFADIVFLFFVGWSYGL